MLTLGRKWAGYMGKYLQLSDNFACLDMLPFTKQQRHILGDGNTMGPRLLATVEKAKEHLLIYTSGLNKFLRISFCSSGGVDLLRIHLIPNGAQAMSPT